MNRLKSSRGARLAAVLGLITVAPLSACASGSNAGSSAAATTQRTISTPGASTSGSGGTAVPSDLLGTYHFVLTTDDLPDNPVPALSTGIGKWTVTIAPSSGTNGGPSLAITNDQYGELESSDITVEGDRIYLHHEECENLKPQGPPYTYVESSYSWRVRGPKLTFGEPTGTCPDKVAQTLLTAKPMTR